MKIQTFSIIVGNKSCNANCPFCISKLTPDCGISNNEIINWRNLKIGCNFAKQCGVSTVLLTGKGEPLVKQNIDSITEYLKNIKEYNFPFIELQTNGTEILNLSDELLKIWYDLGLTTFIISCVHFNPIKNKEIYNQFYPILDTLVNFIHSKGFSVRLSCIMLKDYIDNLEKVLEFVELCKKWEVEQFTIRPVSNNIDISDVDLSDGFSKKTRMYHWIKDHKISNSVMKNISGFFISNATKLLQLMHGAEVFDYKGQNICISNCLTRETRNINEIRQLIFFPDGRLRYDWDKKGAIIL